MTSPNKIDEKTDPKSDEQQKVTIINNKFPQKNPVRTVRKEMALTPI